MKHLIRSCMVCILAVCLSVFSLHTSGLRAAAEHQAEIPDMSGYPEEAAVLVNAFRAENGLEPLLLAPVLLEAASIRAQEQQQSYGHTRPSGEDWFTIVSEVGLDTNCFAAENVAAGYETPETVVEAWKNSPSHRAAMLGEEYEYIGIGVSYLENDPEYYFYYWELVMISSETPLEGAWMPGQAVETTVTTTGTVTDLISTGTTTTNTVPRGISICTKMGDINMDGEISLADVVLMQQIMLGQVTADDVQLLQADCYQDEVVDQKDVLTLMRFLMRIVTQIPVIPS
ncbi:MAG: CAP domain-containing protein [Ruminococcus sp.]